MSVPQKPSSSLFFTGRKDVVDVDDIQEVLVRLKRSGTLPSSDTVVRQEMPLKPEVFHGRDGLIEEIAQLLMKEETSRICILGPGGMGKTSVSLAIVELILIKDRVPLGNCLGAL